MRIINILDRDSIRYSSRDNRVRDVLIFETKSGDVSAMALLPKEYRYEDGRCALHNWAGSCGIVNCEEYNIREIFSSNYFDFGFTDAEWRDISLAMSKAPEILQLPAHYNEE